VRVTASGFAPGKLILSGEHAVVYGHPAVAMAITRGTTVRLSRRPGPSGAASADPRLARALAAVLPPDGVGVSIDSDLPVGRGLGSSAALAVATVRALAQLEGRALSFAECHAGAFAMERVFHGDPSGLDHAVSARGGAVIYRRSEGAPIIEPLTLRALPLVILDSGTAGDTAALVGRVRARSRELAPVLSEIGALTAETIGALDGPLAALGPLLTRGHRLLTRLGVSTPTLDALVELSLGAGGLGAKLSGAGGGGVVLALAPDPTPVLRAAEAAGVSAFEVGLHPVGG